MDTSPILRYHRFFLSEVFPIAWGKWQHPIWEELRRNFYTEEVREDAEREMQNVLAVLQSIFSFEIELTTRSSDPATLFTFRIPLLDMSQRELVKEAVDLLKMHVVSTHRGILSEPNEQHGGLFTSMKAVMPVLSSVYVFALDISHPALFVIQDVSGCVDENANFFPLKKQATLQLKDEWTRRFGKRILVLPSL